MSKEKEELLIEKSEIKNEEEEPKIYKEEEFEEDIPKPIKNYIFKDKDPYTSSSFISSLFYYWAYKVIKLGNLIKIKSKYLGKLTGEYTSEKYLEKIKYLWEEKKYKLKKKYALLTCGFSSNKNYLFVIMILSLIRSLINIYQITIFRLFIKKFSNNNENENSFLENLSHIQVGIIYLLIKIFEIFFSKISFEYQFFLGFKSGAEINCLIFDKILKFSPSSMKKKCSTGEITNFIQKDSQQLSMLMLMSPDLLTMPFMLISYIYMLFKYLGISCIFGFMTMLLFSLINVFFMKYIREFFKKISFLNDKRLKLITETFNNIKILKLYSWEDEFLKRINNSRETQIEGKRQLNKLSNISHSLGSFSPIATSTVCIAFYQYFNSKMKIEDIFSCLNIFSMIQMPLQMFPRIINSFNQTILSLERIEKFLFQDEINENNIIKNDENLIKEGITIKIENGNYSWGVEYPEEKSKFARKATKDILKRDQTKEEIKINFNNEKNNNLLTPQIILKNINLSIKKSEFICIIGEVGSGKSSLLQAILNNLLPMSDDSKIYTNGTISYASQIPWIQNATVKNNILFNLPYDESRYKQIINITELQSDLDILVGGDMTEIGENGVNLSGGQKARINLARALYAEKDIYFLDDPISALDANVGMKVLKNCIINFLKNKTRILVTHALQYVQYSDRIIYMKNGEIGWMGGYEEIKKQEFFKDFYEKSKNPLTTKTSKQIREEFLNEKDEDDYDETNENKEDDINNIEEEEEDENNVVRITKDEDEEIGEVKSSTIKQYLTSVGGIMLIILYLSFLLMINSVKSGRDIFLGYWTTHQSKSSNPKYLLIYTLLGVSTIFFTYFNLVLTNNATLKSSKIIHEKMIFSLIHAPISTYHETIPKGIIINRLSKDIQAVDGSIMRNLESFLSSIVTFITSILVCSLYQPLCLIFIPFLIYSGFKLTKFYMKTSRQITRLMGVLHSPILNVLNETIPGCITIRAFEYSKVYMKKFHNVIDEELKIKIINFGIQQWFKLILDLLSFSFLLFLLIFTFYFKDKFDSVMIGLILTYSINLQNNLVHGLQNTTQLENSLIGFERCLKLIECPSEKPMVEENDEKLKNWPENGKIEFKNYSTRYRPDTDIVLKNINFNVKGNEKIGIVGRTGSGKSTITLCLFRILEPVEGNINIDDIDITTIGLKKLRSNITIIPQDPAIFSGTLRYNIDPLNLVTDDEIKLVMSKIKFDYIINKNSAGLYQDIAENGSNLSVGEKQLICICRAILRRSKIIVMDEATASIDFQTEEIIQNAINEIMKNSTVLTIAHRIKTIIKYDKILVLDNGEIKDFDSPEILKNKKDGIFYELYKKSGA